MQFIWLGLAVVSLLGAFITHSPGLLALCLLVLLVSSFVFVVMLVQSRVEERSRPQDFLPSPAELAALKRKREAAVGGPGGPVQPAPLRPVPKAQPANEVERDESA